jgi:hypothetical protein
LNNQLEAATTARLDTMADAAMVRGVGVALAICAVVAALAAGVTFFALRKGQKP